MIRIKGVGINGKYLLSGAVQCGFCTPGMILAAKALLDVNPAPGVERNTFDMETLIVQTPRSTGPIGATGVGEMCLVPTAPAGADGPVG